MSSEEAFPLAGWRDLLSHTQETLVLAEADDWTSVEARLDERAREIERLSAMGIPPQQSEALQKVVAEIQAADARLQELAEARRQDAVDGLQAEDKGARMKSAYGEVKGS